MNNIRVLIINPDESQNERLIDALKQLSVTLIHRCTRYQKVGDEIKNNAFNLFFLGDKFTDISTGEIVRFLKKHPKTKNVPCWLYTSIKDPEYITSLEMTGIDDTLADPPEAKVLKKAIRNCWQDSKIKDLVQLIKASSFFNGFSTDDLKAVLKITIPRFYESGRRLLIKGRPIDHCYVLLKGNVNITLGTGEHAILMPKGEGTVIGTITPSERVPQVITCSTSSKCVLLEIRANVLNEMPPPLRDKILSKIIISQSQDHLSLLNFTESLVRISAPTDVFGLLPPMEIEEVEEEVEEEKIEQQSLPSEKPAKNPSSEPPQKEKSKQSTAKNKTEKGEKEEEEEQEENVDISENPFTVPTGEADSYNDNIQSQDDYDILHRKINLRAEFITTKIPKALMDIVHNKMFGYWTGGKLAKVNPHKLWSVKLFTPGTPTLKRALHMVVLCSNGYELYEKAYLGLDFSHRVIGLPQIGCGGTFLGSDDAIKRYFDRKHLEKAIRLDFEIPVDRTYQGRECIEFLTHTAEDIRDETLFLVFDDVNGQNTKLVRENYPMHQIITIVKGLEFNPQEPASMFSSPEEELSQKGLLVAKREFPGKGFYNGETFFLADLSVYFQKTNLARHGYIFGTIGMFARVGPDYSGIVWGSKGGAEGAMKAARAMFGVKGAQSSEDIASAIQWADN